MMLAISLAFACWTVSATPVRVIDGDTFVADARIWVGLTQRTTVRVLDVNAPEMHGATRVAGEAAKAYTTEWLKDAELLLNVCEEDAFGRALSSVTRTRDGANLAIDLLQSGHAVRFEPK